MFCISCTYMWFVVCNVINDMMNGVKCKKYEQIDIYVCTVSIYTTHVHTPTHSMVMLGLAQWSILVHKLIGCHLMLLIHACYIIHEGSCSGKILF
jgi:hypothetical protein